jgi:putative endonuclease
MTDKLGQKGEKVACQYLIRNKYDIVATNYKSGHKEIDIITKKNGNYFFIEVKTRLKNKDDLNKIPLLQSQVKNLKIAILDYAQKNKINLETVNLDLIFILVDENKNSAELRHYQNVF